jgi:AAA+ superfamily predicted ATPase
MKIMKLVASQIPLRERGRDWFYCFMVYSSKAKPILNYFTKKSLGPPGVGKTMTAETLAKSCRKILLKVGIGDLGSNAEAIDRSLHKLFEVVTAWHAILLM